MPRYSHAMDRTRACGLRLRPPVVVKQLIIYGHGVGMSLFGLGGTNTWKNTYIGSVWNLAASGLIGVREGIYRKMKGKPFNDIFQYFNICSLFGGWPLGCDISSNIISSIWGTLSCLSVLQIVLVAYSSNVVANGRKVPQIKNMLSQGVHRQSHTIWNQITSSKHNFNRPVKAIHFEILQAHIHICHMLLVALWEIVAHVEHDQLWCVL